MDGDIWFRVLGPLEVSRGGEVVAVPAPKHRVILVALLLRRNRHVSTDDLVDWLWDVPAKKSRSALQQYVHRLRRIVGKDVIRTSAGGYLIDIDPDQVDLERFRALVRRGQAKVFNGDLTGGSALLREGLALWSEGLPLAGVPSDQLQHKVVPWLVEERLNAVERAIEIDLTLGRHRELVAELTGLTSQHPLREVFWRHFMLALYRCGRPAEALDAYATVRTLVADQLGVEPAPELQQLFRSILAEDLEPAPEPSAATIRRPTATFQLPRDASDFVGRDQYIAGIRQVMVTSKRSAAPIVVISGGAGVGKTTLAVHVAHQLREFFPDGQLYVHLHLHRDREPAATPSQVLAQLLGALGVDPSAIPDGIDERAALYRSLTADKRILLVLDDAVRNAHIQPFLPGSAYCGVLVTSRARLTGIPGSRMFALDVLDSANAVELLKRVAGAERVETAPAKATELVTICGQLPLAIRIIGARLAAKPHWTLARMVDRLSDEQSRLDELSHAGLDVRAGLAAGYVGLSPEAKRMFRALCGLEVPDLTAWAAAAAVNSTVLRAEDMLEELVDARLLDPLDSGDQPRYHLNELVRLFGREQA